MDEDPDLKDALNRCDKVHAAHINTGVRIIGNTWSVLHSFLTGYSAALRLSGRAVDREDVIQLCLAEIMDKSATIARLSAQHAFDDADPVDKKVYLDALNEILSTIWRYKRGIPPSFCAQLLETFSHMLIEQISALERTYIHMHDAIMESTMMDAEKRGLLVNCKAKSNNTWTGMVQDMKETLGQEITDPVLIEKVQREIHHYNRLVTESIGAEEAFAEAGKLANKAMAKRDFYSWFQSKQDEYCPTYTISTTQQETA